MLRFRGARWLVATLLCGTLVASVATGDGASAVGAEAAGSCGTDTTTGPGPAWTVHRPHWAVAGSYSGVALRPLRARGLDHVLVEMRWDRAEPTRGTYDEEYLRSVSEQVDDARAAGFRVVLNTGLQDAPPWLLRLPGARFVDQHGQVYTQTQEPNLVFGKDLRPLAAAYLAEVGEHLGDRVDVVRVGGGHWGELTYPRPVATGGAVAGSYWAFDRSAVASTPVPGWRPADPSPRGEARRFLTWYLDSLVDYQGWQVREVHQHFRGTAAVLYPSWGMRPGDFDAAVAQDLSGATSAEVNGEVQMGVDHARQVGALDCTRTAVWGTWMDAPPGTATNPAPFDELAALAAARSLPLMGENAGRDSTVADLQRVAELGREHRATLVMWVRLGDLIDAGAQRSPGALAPGPGSPPALPDLEAAAKGRR